MRIAICDDQLSEREAIAKRIYSVAEKNNVIVSVDFFECGDQLIFEYENPTMHADVLFLDINMPGTDGAKTARMIRNLGYDNLIVFVSIAKSDELYCNAFDVKAYHYIIKHEYSDDKVDEIITGAIENAEKNKQKYFLFECAGECRNVAINDINYFDVLHRIVTVHYGKNESFEFYSPLDKVSNDMEAYGFMRIHRSYIVSLNKVKKLCGEKLWLIDGTELPVSRRCVVEVKNKIMMHHSALNSTRKQQFDTIKS